MYSQNPSNFPILSSWVLQCNSSSLWIRRTICRRFHRPRLVITFYSTWITSSFRSEVWSEDLRRWVHMDCKFNVVILVLWFINWGCENGWDSPRMYEQGWNKKLNYVFGISCNIKNHSYPLCWNFPFPGHPPENLDENCSRWIHHHQWDCFDLGKTNQSTFTEIASWYLSKTAVSGLVANENKAVWIPNGNAQDSHLKYMILLTIEHNDKR